MTRKAMKTVVAQGADFATMPVTFLDGLFRNFRVNIFHDIYVFDLW